MRSAAKQQGPTGRSQRSPAARTHASPLTSSTRPHMSASLLLLSNDSGTRSASSTPLLLDDRANQADAELPDSPDPKPFLQSEAIGRSPGSISFDSHRHLTERAPIASARSRRSSSATEASPDDSDAIRRSRVRPTTPFFLIAHYEASLPSYLSRGTPDRVAQLHQKLALAIGAPATPHRCQSGHPTLPTTLPRSPRFSSHRPALADLRKPPHRSHPIANAPAVRRHLH